MSESEPSPFVQPSRFATLGALIYGYRKFVVLIWIVLVVLSLTLIPQLEGALQGTGMLYEGGQAHQAEQLLQQELKIDSNSLTIVFKTQNSVTETEQTRIQTILNDVRTIPAVRNVISAEQRPEYRNSDGRVQSAIAQLQVAERELPSVVEQIQEKLSQHKTDTLQTYLTGKPAIEKAVQDISKSDLGRVELIALPFTLIALLWVFSSFIAASMPIVMGIMTVSVTLGLLYFVSLKLDISVFALNITSMLGLGLGIDYSLLIVTRFREELTSRSIKEAIIKTVDTAGHSVFFSGLTVCIGLVALLLFPIPLLRSLGIAGSLVVFTSILAALTLLPALLGILGHRIDWGKRKIQPRNHWAAIAQTVIRYRLVAIALVLVIVTGLTSPFFSIRFGLPDANILPQNTSAREGANALEQAFGVGEVSPILVVVRSQSGNPILSDPHIETLYNFVKTLQTDARVSKVSSLFNIDPQLSLQQYQQLYKNPATVPLIQQFSSSSTTLITVASRTASPDQASQALVKDLRALSLPDLQIQVGGQSARGLDTIEIVYQRFPWVLVVIMGVTFSTLCVLLNSVVLPLKAIAMNLLSIGASFGALVFIFQAGNFQTWLNFTSVGYLDILLPVVLFCVLFGLSMDYEVFLLTRIKEAYDRSGDNSKSVIEGLSQTGGMITSAALLMIIVTSAFAFTSIIFVKALGLGTAIAVLIDATLIRAVLVPATMHLMGHWNWWMPKAFNR